ncbi:MAG: ABC transporter ATP-binding protein [Candidatus Omnitrophica bacterium]|nr:ABC transporter ATP-binding protein [Candidatus Omnitrophota bacterium]
MNILTTHNLKVYFSQHRRLVKALDGVDIFLREGLTTALAGESGCGKTTLARTILGFNSPREGNVYFRNTDISLKKNEALIRKNIQIVFQNPFLSLDPRFTIFSTLYEAFHVFHDAKKREAQSVLGQILEEVELKASCLSRFPHQLSGGELQRICIARALINRPSLIILDEPTSSLDVTTASKIIRLLAKLQAAHGITYLFISHNLKILKKISQVCFIMYAGKIVEYGPKELLYHNPLHPYTRLLFEAANHTLKFMPQEQVSPGACAFFPYCKSASDTCKDSPQKKEVEPRHFVYCHNFSR